MSFPYIVVDLINGAVKGIRNEQDAVEQAQCEDVFVIDVINNEWILSDGDRQEITEITEDEDEDFLEPDDSDSDDSNQAN